MKSAVVPFVRQLKSGATGKDVIAVKRALKAAGFGRGLLFTPVFGPQAVANVKRFQQAHRIPATGVYGVKTHRALAAFFDAKGGKLLAAAAPKHTAPKPAKKPDGARERFVDICRWAIANSAQIHYAETRPMPITVKAKTLPLTVDCSGSTTLFAKWAGAPDPNGLGYNGEGFTGTLMNHCRKISRNQVRPGDLAVFGSYPGHHVAVVVGVKPNGDLELESHGSEAGPLDIALSVEQRYQPPVAFYSFLP